MSISTVSFLAELDWNSLPIECFPLTYDLNGFKSRINRHLLNVGFFSTDFLYSLIFLCLFFCNSMPCSGCSNDGIIKLVLQHDIRKNTHSITKQSNRFRHELDIPEETNETA